MAAWVYYLLLGCFALTGPQHFPNILIVFIDRTDRTRLLLNRNRFSGKYLCTTCTPVPGTPYP